MPVEATIEDRLAAVEAAVAEIRTRLLIQPPAPDWLEQVIGSFKDEPAFEEVLAYGRAIRRGELSTEDLVLLTRNTADFGRVPGLVIEDWTV